MALVTIHNKEFLQKTVRTYHKQLLQDLGGVTMDMNYGLWITEYEAERTLMQNYIHLFARGSEDLQETAYLIRMKSDEPIAMPPYRMSFMKRTELDPQVE